MRRVSVCRVAVIVVVAAVPVVPVVAWEHIRLFHDFYYSWALLCSGQQRLYLCNILHIVSTWILSSHNPLISGLGYFVIIREKNI